MVSSAHLHPAPHPCSANGITEPEPPNTIDEGKTELASRKTRGSRNNPARLVAVDADADCMTTPTPQPQETIHPARVPVRLLLLLCLRPILSCPLDLGRVEEEAPGLPVPLEARRTSAYVGVGRLL